MDETVFLYGTIFLSFIGGTVVATIIGHWRWPQVAMPDLLRSALLGALSGTCGGLMLYAMDLGWVALHSLALACLLGIWNVRQTAVYPDRWTRGLRLPVDRDSGIFYVCVAGCVPVGLLYGLMRHRVSLWRALMWSLAYGMVGYGAVVPQVTTGVTRFLNQYVVLQFLFLLPLLAGASAPRAADTTPDGVGSRRVPRDLIVVLVIGALLMQSLMTFKLLDAALVTEVVRFALGYGRVSKSGR